MYTHTVLYTVEITFLFEYNKHRELLMKQDMTIIDKVIITIIMCHHFMVFHIVNTELRSDLPFSWGRGRPGTVQLVQGHIS